MTPQILCQSLPDGFVCCSTNIQAGTAANSFCVCTRHIIEAGSTGMTRAQLLDKLTGAVQQHSNGKQFMAALDTLLDRRLVCWAPSFDQEVLMSTSVVDRLTCGFKGSVTDEPGPAHDFQSLAGLQAEKSTKDSHQMKTSPSQKGSSPDEEGTDNHHLQSPDETAQKASNNSRAAVGSVFIAGSRGQGSEGHCLLRPWLNHEGQLNKPLWSSLTRRVLSVVMRNPGQLQLSHSPLITGYYLTCSKSSESYSTP